MRAVRDRLHLDLAMRNRMAWTMAALTGAAFVGKLRGYDDYFGAHGAPTRGGAQTAVQQETALRLLAQAWGAIEEGS
ncbi:hypothetical protein QWZ10_06975 [Paracoccus cavernae]|uniref:Uncharacterized protein n=2 Tax=Paracoccus cavernae TaxID=1571207 RepID=A0ABT8D5S1_9RHOB|nr:hypothetical protein [Paracoccus cavernae]